MIKRILNTGLLLATFVMFASPAIVFAVEDNGAFNTVCDQPSAHNSTVCQEPDRNPLVGRNGVITNATHLLAMVVGIAAVISIIVNSFRIVTSSGDPEKVKSGRNGVLYSLVGLAVALLAETIVLFVLRKL